MSDRRVRLLAALLAGVVPLALTLAFFHIGLAEARLLGTGSPAAGLPPAIAPLLGANAPKPRLLDAAGSHALTAAVRRSPVEQRWVNLLLVQRGISKPDEGIDDPKSAELLRELGWRDTGSSQNLLIRDALNSRFDAMIDRADSLLRRGKLTDVTHKLLTALEPVPQLQERLVTRLASRPPWRAQFLRYVDLGVDARFRAARLRTLQVLHARGSRLSPDEIAPAVQQLVASGQAGVAWDLWRLSGLVRDKAIVNDEQFMRAATLANADETPGPFDWRLENGPGHSVSPSVLGGGRGGVAIEWTGSGLPVFMSQLVRLPVAGRYALTVTASDADGQGALIDPALICGKATIAFASRTTSSWVSDAVPAGCAFATLQLGARLGDAGRPRSAEIIAVQLRPARFTTSGATDKL